MSKTHTELSKRASDLMGDPNADPAAVDDAFCKMLAATTGAERIAMAAKLREEIASDMGELAVVRKREGKARLDNYCRLLAKDALMGRFYEIYSDVERFLI